jgi:hypothetical protein
VVATAAAGDVLARWWVNPDGCDVGLRGGHWSTTTNEVAISRLATWNYLYPGQVEANVNVEAGRVKMGCWK